MSGDTASIELERGSRVRVDLSVRFEDVDEVVEGEVYRVSEGESLPYYIESKGRVVQISKESVIEVVG